MREDQIVVGVDGSTAARQALRWAVAEACRSDSAIYALTSWTRCTDHEWPSIAPADSGMGRARAETISEGEVERALASTGNRIMIVRKVVEGHPRAVLAAASGCARLLVLGMDCGSLFYRAMVDSAGEHLALRVSCPVMLVPPPRYEPATQAPSLLR